MTTVATARSNNRVTTAMPRALGSIGTACPWLHKKHGLTRLVREDARHVIAAIRVSER
jgi:hypothetical protein